MRVNRADLARRLYDEEETQASHARVFDRKCLEATLVKVTAPLGMVMSVPPHRVSVRHPAKELSNLRIGLRLNHEMPMIRQYAYIGSGSGSGTRSWASFSVNLAGSVLLFLSLLLVNANPIDFHTSWKMIWIRWP